MNEAAGTAQQLYGQLVRQQRRSIRGYAMRLRPSLIRLSIVALGIGWLLGRMHRPL